MFDLLEPGRSVENILGMTQKRQKQTISRLLLYRGEGSNLHKLSLLDPKSSASTNSATAAHSMATIIRKC